MIQFRNPFGEKSEGGITDSMLSPHYEEIEEEERKALKEEERRARREGTYDEVQEDDYYDKHFSGAIETVSTKERLKRIEHEATLAFARQPVLARKYHFFMRGFLENMSYKEIYREKLTDTEKERMSEKYFIEGQKRFDNTVNTFLLSDDDDLMSGETGHMDRVHDHDDLSILALVRLIKILKDSEDISDREPRLLMSDAHYGSEVIRNTERIAAEQAGVIEVNYKLDDFESRESIEKELSRYIDHFNKGIDFFRGINENTLIKSALEDFVIPENQEWGVDNAADFVENFALPEHLQDGDRRSLVDIVAILGADIARVGSILREVTSADFFKELKVQDLDTGYYEESYYSMIKQYNSVPYLYNQLMDNIADYFYSSYGESVGEQSLLYTNIDDRERYHLGIVGSLDSEDRTKIEVPVSYENEYKKHAGGPMTGGKASG